MSTFYDEVWWELLLALPGLPFAALSLVDLARRLALPGSRPRYLLATAQWTCIGVGAGLPLLLLVETSAAWQVGHVGHGLLVLVAVLACAAMLVLMARSVHGDGDDHWWRRTGHRLHRTLRTRVAAGRLTPAPVPR